MVPNFPALGSGRMPPLPPTILMSAMQCPLRTLPEGLPPGLKIQRIIKIYNEKKNKT